MKKEYKLFITNNYIYIMSNNKLLKYPINKKETIINNYLIINSKLLKKIIKKILNKNIINAGVLLPNITIFIFKKYPTTVKLLIDIFKELNFKNITIKCIRTPSNSHLIIFNNNNLEIISHSINSFSNVLNKNDNYIMIGTRNISSILEKKYHIKIFYYNELKFYEKILSQ